jgi:hypothetical protein
MHIRILSEKVPKFSPGRGTGVEKRPAGREIGLEDDRKIMKSRLAEAAPYVTDRTRIDPL